MTTLQQLQEELIKELSPSASEKTLRVTVSTDKLRNALTTAYIQGLERAKEIVEGSDLVTYPSKKALLTSLTTEITSIKEWK